MSILLIVGSPCAEGCAKLGALGTPGEQGANGGGPQFPSGLGRVVDSGPFEGRGTYSGQTYGLDLGALEECLCEEEAARVVRDLS